jgi:hypothetical protein
LVVENGRNDLAVVGYDSKQEFGRLADIYRKLGVEDRLRYAEFEGEHYVDGEEAFAYLEKYL